jgi:hypothetical protein
MLRRIAAVALTAALVSAGQAAADEGMWTFDNFPTQRVNQTYGTRIDQAWLDRVQGAAVRIPGCSASVVSPEGLVLTNYHCVESCASQLSTPQTDYFATGFLTRTRADEKQCPGMTAEVLQTISDVTPRVLGAGQGCRRSARKAPPSRRRAARSAPASAAR